MPVPSRAVGALVRWGIRYAPIAYAGWRGAPRHGGVRSGRPGRDGRSDDDALARAIDHAEHLIEGSLLPVFHGDTRVWVVFSGDQPVGSHPVVRMPLPVLLEYYDLTKRVRPGEVAPPTPQPSTPGRGLRQWSTDRLRQRRPGRLRHRVARVPRGAEGARETPGLPGLPRARARRPAGSA